MKKQKLELTWIGKDVRPKLEPRILLEDPSKSYHAKHRVSESDIFDNRLIFGDNLLALKALEAEFAGKVKCIYIDPPYNTGNAFEHYDDGLEHSIWLGLMRDRLEILWRLLANDGLMAVQIDDNEFARLFLLLAEICGEASLKVICVKMSEPSGLKMGSVKRMGTIPKLKEYIILCKRDGVRNIVLDRIPKGSWDTEYNIFLNGITKEDRDRISELSSKEDATDVDIEELDDIAAKVVLGSVAVAIKEHGIDKETKDAWLYENSWRICQCATSASVLTLAKEKRLKNQNSVFFVKSVRGILYMVRSGFSDESAKPRVQLIFADENLSVHPGDMWTDFKTTGLDGEGGVDFKNGKKPEALVARIIKMATKPNDLVLDSFAGSGTTGAVAHKMGRRWIMVELGDHCHTHIIPRLQKVIDSEDQGGISQAVNWQGGGGFRHYRLAPSLLLQDTYGQWVINKEYNPDMLTAAISKLEGFTYAPSADHYWQHGYSTENDFIYVTTQSLNAEQLHALSDEVGHERTLLVCCAAFRGDANRFLNLTVKKIPKMVLQKCEWGHDDYSLNVENLPQAPKSADSASQAGLFGDDETNNSGDVA
ncbi:MAG TPA: site-specific DNA-methyltransferase [Methylotenera sp.]|nr:site-specific DNA-methyltransferase [Methylotenera sp.]